MQFKVDTQDEAIKTLTSAKERLEKEKHKLGEFLGKKVRLLMCEEAGTSDNLAQNFLCFLCRERATCIQDEGQRWYSSQQGL